MVKNYLKVALRSILKNKIFSIINICGLALGVTAFLLIVHYVQFEQSYDRQHAFADRLYRVPLDMYLNGELSISTAENYPGVGPAMALEIPEVEAQARLYNLGYKNNVIITWEDAPIEPVQYKQRSFLYADSSFLPLFGYELISGDPLTALAAPFSAVISDEYAEKFFGDEDPIGKMLRLQDDDRNNELCRVTGVFKKLPGNTHLKFDVLFSYKTLFTRGDWAPGRYDESWQRKDMYTYVRLAEGTDPSVVENKLPDLINKYNPALAENNREDRMWLQPVTDIHLTSRLTDEPEIHGNAETVNAMLIVGLFIMIIAWVNYINLSTAKAVERAKEVGIRKTLGAYKRQLVIQFFVESAIINLVAVFLSIFLALLILPFFNDLSGHAFTAGSFFNLFTLLVLAGIWLTGTLLSGAYPSFVLSSFRPVKVLKGRLTTQKGGVFLRRALVIFQFVASVAMISGTLIVYNQLDYMLSQDIGMDIDQVLVVERPGVSPAEREQFNSSVEAFRNTLAGNPAINGVAMSVTIPGKTREYKAPVKRYGAADDDAVVLRLNSMDYEFLDVFGMEVIAGRGFSPAFVNDPDTSVLITESAVSLLGFENPEQAVGSTIEAPSFNFSAIVVGVVNDYHQESLQKSTDPILFYCTLYGGEFYSMKISRSNIASTIDHVENAWNSAFPGNPFEYFFLDEYFNQQYRNERRFQNLFGSFAILAIIVGCLGLFGLSAYSAQQRTKEIGVRKVMGSSVFGIFTLLSKSYMLLIGISILLAIPLAYFTMSQWLESFAYREAISPLVFVVAAISVILISLITISYQTLKAARINPVESLRYE